MRLISNGEANVFCNCLSLYVSNKSQLLLKNSQRYKFYIRVGLSTVVGIDEGLTQIGEVWIGEWALEILKAGLTSFLLQLLSFSLSAFFF